MMCLWAGLPAFAQDISSVPEDRTSAVILSYSRIGEDLHPDTSLTTEQFNAHLQEILSQNYHVMSIPDLISALKQKTPLPSQTVAITFHGAYRSAYEHGMKALLQNNIPFTVFYAADHASAQLDTYLNWQELEALNRHQNATLGILPASNLAIGELEINEIRSTVNSASAAHREEFGQNAQYFALPYGEYTNSIAKALNHYSFDAQFGMHSGAVHPGSDLEFLPRFVMTENYANLERFRLVTHALPLPVHDIHPYPPELEVNIGLSLPETLQDQTKRLTCFFSGQEDPVEIEQIGARIELRANEDRQSQARRMRMNCTMPGPHDIGEQPRWRWFGMLFTNPEIAQ